MRTDAIRQQWAREKMTDLLSNHPQKPELFFSKLTMKADSDLLKLAGPCISYILSMDVSMESSLQHQVSFLAVQSFGEYCKYKKTYLLLLCMIMLDLV